MSTSETTPPESPSAEADAAGETLPSHPPSMQTPEDNADASDTPNGDAQLLPVLPLKGTVIFPLQAMPLVVGRPGSVAAVEAALSTEDKTLVVVAQRDSKEERPTLDDLYPIGTKVVIKRMVPAERALQIIVQGIERVRVHAAPDAPTGTIEGTPGVESDVAGGRDQAGQVANADDDAAARGDEADVTKGTLEDHDFPDSDVESELEWTEPTDVAGERNNDAASGDEHDAADAVKGKGRVVRRKPKAGAAPLWALASPLQQPNDWDTEIEALHREVTDLAGKILEAINPEAQDALSQMVDQIETPLNQVYILSSLISLDTVKEQQLLSANTLREAMTAIHQHLNHEYNVLQIRQQIADKTQSELSKEQREYTLRKQLAAIQAELGEQNPEQADIDELRKKFAAVTLPEKVKSEIDRELQRLERLPSASPDYQMTRSYLDLAAELPWDQTTQDNLDLNNAQQILDEDHHGLDKVKQRIIEHLAVLKLNPNAKSPIVCFVGPPGVGKTSLGQSIARALEREFERLSLGGLSDESELRGHRRTYIGAMPGRIIQAVRNAKVRNPLIMLDEIDKLGRDFRGDPSAALLEILDPAQNSTFRDNYLNLPFDLSGVMFIATANSLDTIPRPLLDRMEVIQLSGYSDIEKLHIATRYLVPRRVEDAGLTADQMAITPEAVRYVISRYTREAGVRQLERELGSLCRKVATMLAKQQEVPEQIDVEQVIELLGPERVPELTRRQHLQPGVAAGLAWTAVGGDVLYVEAVALPDSKELTLTGQLGDVMKESARTAQSFIRSQWAELNIEKQSLQSGMHLHVPAGATPKDGPSAGVTIATALASVYTFLPMRDDVAMTGELTLTGLVLPVGGIKEKVLAAHRAGMTEVILPAENEKDLVELPDSVRESMRFHSASHIVDVLKIAIPKLANRLDATLLASS